MIYFSLFEKVSCTSFSHEWESTINIYKQFSSKQVKAHNQNQRTVLLMVLHEKSTLLGNKSFQRDYLISASVSLIL